MGNDDLTRSVLQPLGLVVPVLAQDKVGNFTQWVFVKSDLRIDDLEEEIGLRFGKGLGARLAGNLQT